MTRSDFGALRQLRGIGALRGRTAETRSLVTPGARKSVAREVLNSTRALRATVLRRAVSLVNTAGTAMLTALADTAGSKAQCKATALPLAHAIPRTPRLVYKHRWHLAQPKNRGLTCRSTGAPTACRLGRDAVVVHHPPRGPGATPLSPG
jgi:hypothetical protein